MKRNDFHNKAVVITGGTKGIGLATGLAFGRNGAHLYLTHRWGSADENEIRAKFAEAGALEPTIVEADVSQDEDTKALMELIKERHKSVEVFVSNVCIVQPADGIESYKKRSLLRSLEYSAWPFVAYMQQIQETFEKLPRYVIGMSSDGPDNYFSHYEYVAVSKAVMETMCRYLSRHLRHETINLNIIRSRNVLTDAVTEIFGEKYVRFMSKYAGEENFMAAEEIANVALALCSGMLDAVNGQVIQVDKGAAFADTLMRTKEQLEKWGEL
ncbi:MAG: SDR family oxidoreductase [Deltaproteobacteria bacterium]|nr:SDR family oxidoreductase [Deltaproteobacteria bacterium]